MLEIKIYILEINEPLLDRYECTLEKMKSILER